MVKLQQKISGTWCNLEGARNYCTVRRCISTMRKKGQDILHGLRPLFEEDVWIPGSCPSDLSASQLVVARQLIQLRPE